MMELELEPARKQTRKALEAFERLKKEFRRCIHRLARELDKENLPASVKDAVLIGAIEETLHSVLRYIDRIDRRVVPVMLDDMRREFVCGRNGEFGYG
jgi:hypothetical protein